MKVVNNPIGGQSSFGEELSLHTRHCSVPIASRYRWANAHNT